MSDNVRYVAKNPEDPLEELLQMADLVCCPEELVLSQYNNFMKEIPAEDAYKACCILLQCWNKHRVPLMEKLRGMGVL